MALADLFLRPLGLLGLLALIPLVLLYLLRPDPATVRLPTMQFLGGSEEEGGRRAVLERLRRSLLLLIQAIALVALATSLAAPYVPVSEDVTVEETVVVLDTSASMATAEGGTPRFQRARDRAGEAITATTSVVVTATPAGVAVRRGTATDAREAVDGLTVTDAPGNLRTAIDQATSLAGEDARIVVVSDFADTTDWRTGVRAARARGVRVDLEQVGSASVDNVGIVDRRLTGEEVHVTVRNFGGSHAQRTLRFAGETRAIDLGPGDAQTATFSLPPGGGTLELTPGDAFPTDDRVVVAAPQRADVRVLYVSNDPNRYIRTALAVNDAVSLTVREPPTTVTGTFDVVIFGDVDPNRLLQSTVETGRETTDRGGGVAILAQDDLGQLPFGDLLLIDPAGRSAAPSLAPAAEDPLTAGIAFPPPEEYIRGDLRTGRALVSTTDGTPLVATAARGSGQLLYYGYLEEASAFKFNYLYPVFWKRAVFFLADRPAPAELNRRTGERLSFGTERTVETPTGSVTASTVVLDQAGAYVAGDRRYGVGLLSAAESDVVAPSLNASPEEGVPLASRTEERSTPFDLSPYAGLIALGVVFGELAFLRRRGDL